MRRIKRVTVKKRGKTEPEKVMEVALMEQKQEGEIIDFKYEGLSLAWGIDPETGKPMWYTPDFVVTLEEDGGIVMVMKEVKGPFIYEKDKIRFKGCRAEWPQFHFEMWQLKRGRGWERIY